MRCNCTQLLSLYAGSVSNHFGSLAGGIWESGGLHLGERRENNQRISFSACPGRFDFHMLPFLTMFCSSFVGPSENKKVSIDGKPHDLIQFLSSSWRMVLTPGAHYQWMLIGELSPGQNAYLDVGAILWQALVLSYPFDGCSL